MSMNEWKARLDAIKRSCERFDRMIQAAGVTHPLPTLDEFKLGPPATEKEIQQVETKLGCRLPTGFRNVLLHFSASFSIHWCVRKLPPFAVDERQNIFCGECSWSLDKLLEYHESTYGVLVDGFNELDDSIEGKKEFLEFIRHHRIWMEAGNGDILFMGVDENRQDIVYMAHDAGGEDSACLGRDFESAIDRWMQVAFVGSDYYDTEYFVDESGVDPESDLSKRFRAWFFQG